MLVFLLYVVSPRSKIRIPGRCGPSSSACSNSSGGWHLFKIRSVFVPSPQTMISPRRVDMSFDTYLMDNEPPEVCTWGWDRGHRNCTSNQTLEVRGPPGLGSPGLRRLVRNRPGIHYSPLAGNNIIPITGCAGSEPPVPGIWDDMKHTRREEVVNNFV